MSELTDKLGQILTIKQNIGTNIVAKGYTVSNFESYPAGVQNIPTGDQRVQKRLAIFETLEESIEYSTDYDSPDENTYEEIEEQNEYYMVNLVGFNKTLRHDVHTYGGMPGYEDTDAYYIIEDGNWRTLTATTLEEAFAELFEGTNIIYTFNTGTELANELTTLAGVYNIIAYISAAYQKTTWNRLHEPGEEPEPEDEGGSDDEPEPEENTEE